MTATENTQGRATWTVRPRRIGTTHIVRSWAVCRDGVEIDRYEDRSLADGYVAYQNQRAS